MRPGGYIALERAIRLGGPHPALREASRRGARFGRRGGGLAAEWTPLAMGAKISGWYGRLGVLGAAGSDTVDVVDADSSGTINLWRDLGHLAGGYARDATRDLIEATDGFRPNVATVLGKSVPAFDRDAAAEDRLTSNGVAVTSIFSSAEGVIAVAYNPASVVLNSGTAYLNDPLVYGPAQYYGIYLATSGLWVHAFDVADEPIQFAGKGVSAAPHVALLHWDQTSGDVRGYCDGLTVSLNPGFTGLGSTAGNALRVGALTAAQDSEVTVYEVVCATSATAAEEQNLVRYLATRWGVTLT